MKKENYSKYSHYLKDKTVYSDVTAEKEKKQVSEKKPKTKKAKK